MDCDYQDMICIDQFVVGCIYQYTDRFGKFKHVEITDKKGGLIEYKDSTGVKHRSRVYQEEYDGFVEEFFYINRTNKKVNSFDCIGV